ncbi:O-fucosyltransferase 36-like isoform X2 [Benincasa hispida]|uniref:O-fucosyltransferase 36-like isoform X2 n=1 Tax=Benincasa hispida TaxID=102211 RepID=UPI001900E243|nr:O-fucosyltransferase 36-like isoform X2 [Benincasa hispida]
MEKSDSYSDEDDDRENLIDQNEINHSPSPHSAAFHVGGNLDLRSTFPCRRFSFKKRYLFAIFLPLFLLLLYFSTDVRNLFSGQFSSSFRAFDLLGYRMKESELHALFLLKQQRLGLLSIWNHSFNSTSEDLKLSLLRQISLNKEIQNVLLSPHQTGNSSNEVYGDGLDLVGFGFDRCRKVDQEVSQRRTIEWNPKSNKFLFAICASGQMSNHLICLEKHMFFAAILNRVLVIPSSKVDYQYSRVLDVDHVNNCLGRKAVISFEEFSEIQKKRIQIDKFFCYFSKPDHCYLDEEHVKQLNNIGVSTAKLESPWDENIKNPSNRTVQDIQSKFSSDADVIAIGDVFYANVENNWFVQPGGPIAHKCKTLIEPSHLIMVTAQRFIQTFLGSDFIAIHFRRHGFLKFCNAKRPSCFYPIPQAANCIASVVERSNSPVIYLSTDTADSETGLLQSLVIVNGKLIPLVKRPPRNSAEKWDALLYRHEIEGDSQVEAMLDKTICAMSRVFIGTSGSTFTEDILRLRKDWRSASLCDEYLCQGQDPNFVAENE